VKKPFDGREVTVGNGSMLAFQVSTQAEVHNLHRAGIEAVAAMKARRAIARFIATISRVLARSARQQTRALL
jgi:hypothetical protein